MEHRNWNLDQDYPILVKWWKDWQFGVVPKDCLPPDGIIVEEEGVPICAGGLYIQPDKTKFAFMEWIVTDKAGNPKQTHKALRMCIDGIIDMAKQNGIKLIYTTTKVEALQKRYVKFHKFIPAESNVKTFLLDLDGGYAKDLEWIQDEEQFGKHNK
jgi:hypothetical protein